MSPVKKPIKIAVIDEDEENVSKPKTKKKVAVNKKKAVVKKNSLNKATTTAAKKKLVTEAIDTETEGDVNIGDSFADKLKKELENSTDPVAPNNKKIISSVPAQADIKSPSVQNINNSQALAPSLSKGEDEEIQEIVKTKARNNRSINVYRRIAYFFIFLVFILLVTSAYFLLTKVTITLAPDQERMSNNLIFDVRDSESDISASHSNVIGVVKTIKIENEKNYPASGSEIIGKEAVGKVTLINSYSKSQMLVATTRLLSASGDLFRLKNTTNVPAGGEIEVEVYADEPSPDMAIGPTKFSIPGLWAGLQDKIYGESKEKIVYQQKVKKHITQDDIDKGVRNMRQQLLIKAKTEINKSYSDYDEIIYNIDDESISSSIDAEAGDELNEATISMSADVIVVAFSSDEAAKLAELKFVSSLADNKELLSFDKENIIYSLNNYDSVDGVATINATFEGKISLKENSTIVDKEKIIGLNQRQLEIFLGDMKDISGFDIKFYPSFLPEFLKKVPRLPERIEVEVKK